MTCLLSNVRAEKGGSILILDDDVVRRELMARPIATRLGAADKFSHADDKVLRVETRLAADTKSCVVDWSPEYVEATC